MRETIDGICIHRTWLYSAAGTGIRHILSYISFALTCFIGLMRADRPNLLFVDSPPLTLGFSGWIASKLLRVPFVFNVADLWPDSVRDLGIIRDGPLLRAAEWLEAKTYHEATYVNAVTMGIAEALRAKKRVPETKLRYLPNGIDAELFSPRAADERLRDELNVGDRHVFLYAGTHGIAQGLQNVLDAAELVTTQGVVVFVGAGPAKAALVEEARRRGLANVRFVGPVPLEEMPAYFSIARAAIVPLVRSEVTRGARPSKLFPAFASGVPVIYSGEGEGAGIVSDAGAGIVTPPEDPAGIASAMRTLCVDEQLHEEMARNARRLAVEEFDWSPIVEAWLASIEGSGSVNTLGMRARGNMRRDELKVGEPP
jgi:colanic acid biosynthesis glycosyl transferase WcaI